MSKIVFRADGPIDEVVDSIADLFRIGITLEKTLEEGFQFVDVVALLPLEPVAREVINDVPVFLEQFRALNPRTAVEAVGLAKTRVQAEFPNDFGKIPTAIFGFLTETALTYGFVKTTVDEGTARFNAWQVLLDSLKKPEAPEA